MEPVPPSCRQRKTFFPAATVNRQPGASDYRGVTKRGLRSRSQKRPVALPPGKRPVFKNIASCR